MGLIELPLRPFQKHARVKAIIGRLKALGTFHEVLRSARTGYTAYALVLRVDALTFEHAMTLPEAGSEVRVKLSAQLSNETRGYIWVTQDSMERVERNSATAGDHYDSVWPFGPGTHRALALQHPLRLRRGVLGAQLRRTFALLR